jgi:hypothetical protein
MSGYEGRIMERVALLPTLAYTQATEDGIAAIAAEADAALAEKDKRINDLKAERDEYVEAAIRTELAEAEVVALRAKLEKPKCRCTGWHIVPPEVCDSFTPWDGDEDCRECSHELGCHSSVDQEVAALRAKVAAGEDALSGLRYIEMMHGRLDGVGWDRVFDAARAAGLGGDDE